MTFEEHLEKHKLAIDSGIWVTANNRHISFASLDDSHLSQLLLLLAQKKMLSCAFAQRLVAIAQLRQLDWRTFLSRSVAPK